MYVGVKKPRGDGERYVTPARAAAKETKLVPISQTSFQLFSLFIFFPSPWTRFSWQCVKNLC